MNELKIRVSVVRFDVQDAQVSRRPWMAESDPPLATFKTMTYKILASRASVVCVILV